MPDFFEGDGAKEEWFPADTAEKKDTLAKFLQEKANAVAVAERVLVVRKEVTEKWPGVDEHVGVFGLCFGGE